MSASETAVEADVEAAAVAPAGRGPGAGSEAVYRLMPKPLLIVVSAVLCAMVLIPVLYILLASLNTDSGVASGEFWPSSFSLESYQKIWTTVGLGRGLVNSFIVCGATAVVSALLAVSTAYVLVRYAFRGRLTILRGLLGLQGLDLLLQAPALEGAGHHHLELGHL